MACLGSVAGCQFEVAPCGLWLVVGIVIGVEESVAFVLVGFVS